MLEFLSDNWQVIVVPAVGIAFVAFRAIAKRTANKWDDKIVEAADGVRDEVLAKAEALLEKKLAEGGPADAPDETPAS